MQNLGSVISSSTSVGEPTTEARPSKPEARLQDLIPIAMVIVGGCEPCAEKMVTRALELGTSWQDIDKTLRIITDLQTRDCFAKAVGVDVVTRMEKPLAAGWRTLRQAITEADN